MRFFDLAGVTTQWLVLLLLVLLRLRKAGKSNSGLTHLAKARIEKGLSIADITRLTGLSYDNYIKYEHEEVDEQYKCIETLKKLDVTILTPIEAMNELYRLSKQAKDI